MNILLNKFSTPVEEIIVHTADKTWEGINSRPVDPYVARNCFTDFLVVAIQFTIL